jgi:uncharacterized membrane protein YjfL (UPF0719 family)
MVTTALIGISTPVMAAPAAREDTSNYLAWGFLAICGLIVLFQIVPVISLAVKVFRGLSDTKDAEMEAAPSKYR